MTVGKTVFLQRLSLRRSGGKLALLAFWFQLVLSFGHIHPEDIFGPLGHDVAQGHGITEVSSLPPGVPFHPTLPSSADAVDDACAICASIAMLATSILPEQLRLPVPQQLVADLSVSPQPLLLLPPRFLLFHTRAPPAV